MDLLLIATSMLLIAGTFSALDWFISDKEDKVVKDKLFDWWLSLSNFNSTEVANAAKAKLESVFNSIYGKKHFSLRCFFVSCVTSIVAMMLCLIAMKLYLGKLPMPGLDDVYTKSAWVKNFSYYTLFNFIIDYLSLIETRWIFGLNKRINIVVLSVLDIALSLMIFLVITALIALPLYSVIYGFPQPSFMVVVKINYDFFFQIPNDYSLYEPGLEGNSIYGIFGWSTLFTSLLFQSYILFTLAVKFLGLFKGRIVIFLERIESKDRTVMAFGIFLAGLSGILMTTINLLGRS